MVRDKDRASVYSTIIAALENATDEKLLERAKKALESSHLEKVIGKSAPEKLDPLRAEIEFHLEMRQAARAQEQEQYSKAAELYRDALKAWHQIPYRDLLRFQVANPYELAKQCQELAYRVETPCQLAAQAKARLEIAVDSEEEEFVRLGLRAGLLADPSENGLRERTRQLLLRRRLRAVRQPHEQDGHTLLDDLVPTETVRAMNMFERERAWLDSAIKYVQPFANNTALRDQKFDAFYFGCLSFAFLFGIQLQTAEKKNVKYVVTRLSGQAKTDWDALSEGARYILLRLVHPKPRARYATATQVWKALDTLNKRWEKTPTALAQTRRKSDMDALFDLDLARRRALADGTIIEGLEEHYGELYAQFKGRWEKLAQDARLAIETGRYQEALEMLGASSADDQAAVDADPTIAFQLSRYRLMAHGCLNALTEYPHKQLWQHVVNEMQGDPRPFPKSEEERRRGTILVTRALADMDDESKIENVREILGAATKLDTEGKVLAQAMRPLYAEANLYFNLRQGRRALANGEFDAAREFYAEAKTNWQEIPYQNLLEFSAEDPERALEQVKNLSAQFSFQERAMIPETTGDLQDAEKCARIRRGYLLRAQNGSAAQFAARARHLKARQMLATVRSVEMQEKALDKAAAILELTRLMDLLAAFPDDAYGAQVRGEWQTRLVRAEQELEAANKLVVGVATHKNLMDARTKLEALHSYAFDVSKRELVGKSNLEYPKGLGDLGTRIQALDARISEQQRLAAEFAGAIKSDFSRAKELVAQAKKQEVMLDDTSLDVWTERLQRWSELENKLNELKRKTQRANGIDTLDNIQNELDQLSQTPGQDIPPSLSERIETLRKQLKSKWDAEFTQIEAKIKRELSLGNPDQAKKLLNDALDIANKSNNREFVNRANDLQNKVTNAYKKQVETASFWLEQAAKSLEPKPNPPSIAPLGSRDSFSSPSSFYGVNPSPIQTPSVGTAKPDYELAAKYLLLAEERLVQTSNRGDENAKPNLKRLTELRAKLPEEWRPDNFEKLLQRAADAHIQTAEAKWKNQDKDAAFHELEQATRLWPAVEIKNDGLKSAWEQSRQDRMASLEQFALAKLFYDKQELEQAIQAIGTAIEMRERGTTRQDETLDEWRKMHRVWFVENKTQQASAAYQRAQEFYQAGNLDQAIAEITSAIQARQDGLIEQRVDDVERQQDADVTEWNKQKETWTREQKTKQEQWQKDAQEWQSLIAVPANREQANEKLADMEQNATRGLYLQSDQARLTTMRAIQNACGELARCADDWKAFVPDKRKKQMLGEQVKRTIVLLNTVPQDAPLPTAYWKNLYDNVSKVTGLFFPKPPARPPWTDADANVILLSALTLDLHVRNQSSISK